MMEFNPVAFYFNQDEYQASVISGHEVKTFIRLPDREKTIVTISLDDDHGIQKIETVTEAQFAEYEAQSEEKIEIMEAKKVEGSLQFCLGFPSVPQYELKLKNGRIISAEPRLDSGSSIKWIQRYTEKYIAANEIKGWRVKKF